MSIGFTFTGRVKKPEALIAAAQKLADERYYGLYHREDGLSISLCPLDGRVYMTWKKESGLFGQWTVAGECVSTPAGPGLHKAAVEVLDSLGLKNLTVEDETEYYQHRDFDRMLREHFHPWLNTMVDVLTGQFGEDHSSVCMCWDIDSYMPEDVPGTVVTPVGRFSAKWMKETVEDQGIQALAERFFLWYHPGRRDALYDRQVALNLLWELCYFAPSSRHEEDAGINEDICKNLEMAAQLDPSLPLPRRAYEEICQLARRAPALPRGPELEEEFAPGYRKGLVTCPIGALRLTLPGSYRYEREQWKDGKGCDKWADISSHSPIWRVNGYRMGQGEAAFTPILKDDNDLTEHEIKGGAIRYGWREMDDKEWPYFQVRAEVITGPSLFVITVTHLEPEDRPGIVELVRKITVQTQDVEKQTIQADK
ncbi:MAG: hypothetical protein HFF54_08885 [Lawsonibacter sp.]|nr:hypothetical protein [Lawsonibacter sp.]